MWFSDPSDAVVWSTPGAGCGTTVVSAGPRWLTWRKSLTRIGFPSPRAYTRTATGSPLRGSAQMSTVLTVVAALAGCSASPAASTPATRRVGSRVSRSVGEASPSSDRASDGGSRSEARGSRIGSVPTTRVSRFRDWFHR
jgi:hypothetical protein